MFLIASPCQCVVGYPNQHVSIRISPPIPRAFFSIFEGLQSKRRQIIWACRLQNTLVPTFAFSSNSTCQGLSNFASSPPVSVTCFADATAFQKRLMCPSEQPKMLLSSRLLPSAIGNSLSLPSRLGTRQNQQLLLQPRLVITPFPFLNTLPGVGRFITFVVISGPPILTGAHIFPKSSQVFQQAGYPT